MTNDHNFKQEEVLRILPKILPAMQADGGGLELAYINDDIVYVRLVGACTHCPSVSLTMKLGIEKTLKTNLPWVKGVERVA